MNRNDFNAFEDLHHASLAMVHRSPAKRNTSPSLILSNARSHKGNEISFMHESSDFHWCTEEEEYQRNLISSHNAPKSIFQGSFLNTFNKEYDTNNYEVISRNIDANLAEIDMETFKSEDINAILSLPNMLSHESPSVQQQGGEEFASVSDSLLQEIEFDSRNASNQASCEGLPVFTKNEPLFSSRKELDTNEEESEERKKREHEDGNGISCRVATTDISIDSLDMSSFEDNTNEVVMRCAEQDKTRYTIAFEESLSSLTFTDSTVEEDEKREMCGERSANDRKIDLTKSEQPYVTWNRLQRDLVADNDCKYYIKTQRSKSNAKQSKSLPNIIQISNDKRDQGFIPLYDLSNSPSSKSGELNGPRSLLRLYIQNHFSPSTSGENSTSVSFESHLQESGGAVTNIMNTLSKHNFTNTIGLQVIEETNNNETFDNGNNTSLTIRDNEDDNDFEDSLMMNETCILSPHKTPFNRLKQASPIKEEDEPLSDSSRADVTMRSASDDQNVCQQKEAECNAHSNNISVTHRSSSADRNTFAFNGRQSLDSNFNANKIPKTTGLSREFSSSSSGYGSSRQGSTEWLRKVYTSPVKNKSIANVMLTTTRTTSTQVPVHIKDKEVQTSLVSSKSMDFVLKENSHANEREVRFREICLPFDRKPFYVCYPNYSLPDLSFLAEKTKSEVQRNTPVYLSPTKLKKPSRESVSSRLRGAANKGARPKSCTDYEKLTKQNFSHIKDWDSLKVLLPNEFKTLIDRLKGMNEAKEETNSTLPRKHPSQIPIQNCGVRLRSPQKRMVRKSLSNEGEEASCSCGKINKRFSLQEPIDAGYQPNTNTSPVRKKTMSKSVTMPCHCVCQWYHSRCCSCCHHHCHGAHCVTHCRSPIGGGHTQFLNEPFVDELCEMISMDMTPKEVTNIIGGHGNKVLSPTKHYEPINEQNEDSNSFKELQKHWEAIATSPGNGPKNTVLTTAKPTSKSPDNTLETNKTNTKTVTQNRKKPQIPDKPVQCAKRVHLTGKQALRPTTLNTQHFKSMIPIAKGSKSPPGTKASPTHANN
ncbi:uncharacterized protein B4U79_13502 [Dinothrombium tinctorium]|uniref:Uncharacterized protein n=1 Tax=Dinothrombium tinctorium TaxID=1965070 RepID=A0A3S3SG16_9ACAR|nr:uncharacterized protein B4U79_13502 [Dinothrombium tinctorium]